MAGRYANLDAQRSLKKLNGEVVVDKQDNKDFVNIAKAHASAGNMGDMVTIMGALARFEQTNDVTAAIKEQNAEDRKIMLAEIDARLGTNVAPTVAPTVEPEPEVMPQWAKTMMGQVFSRIAALEKK
tara:strand:+ start:106 stop:486 length:381 start_codon:yes stop_codon:yes gene_type:complete